MIKNIEAYYEILGQLLDNRIDQATTTLAHDYWTAYAGAIGELRALINDPEDNRSQAEIAQGITSYRNAVNNLKATGLNQDIVTNTWSVLFAALDARFNRLSPIDTLKALLDGVASDYAAASQAAKTSGSANAATQAGILFDLRTIADSGYTELAKAWNTLRDYEIEFERLTGEYKSGDATAWDNYIQDGQYGTEVNRISPDGVVYGASSRVQQVEKKKWWDGQQWVDYEVAGRCNSFDELPVNTLRPFGQTWEVRRYVRETNEYVYDPYFWDSSIVSWRPIRWYWPVEKESDLPQPAFAIGEGHAVVYTDVPVYFNGNNWGPEKHSNLWDDEPLKHSSYLLIGSMTLRETATARVVYYSNTEIGLEAVRGTPGQVWVNGEFVTARREASLYNTLPCIYWDASSNTVYPRHIEPDTSYWIYLAGEDIGFMVDALPADGERLATVPWDFRQKLFLSQNTDVNGYLGATGAGAKARLVGRITTDNTIYSEGGPYFLRDMDISLIATEVSLPETFREYSDFTLRYQDNDRIVLDRLPGTKGSLYVAGQLYRLGTAYTLMAADYWIQYNEAAPGIPNSAELRTDSIAANCIWYVYIAAPVDEFNFNAINPATSRPWQSSDENAEGNYLPSRDMRLRVFLSDNPPDDYMLSRTWPGYMTRFLGTVVTDDNAGFIPSANISAIRIEVPQAVLASATAEVRVDLRNEFEIRLVAQTGTSGMLAIGDEALVIPPEGDTTPFMVGNNGDVYHYNEANTESLESVGTVDAWPDGVIYLYVGNRKAALGPCAGGMFFADSNHVNGHLSTNWPGNNARFVAAVNITSGRFSELGEVIAGLAHASMIDNEPEKHRVIDDTGEVAPITLWSSQKNQFENNRLWAALSNHLLFEVQKSNGIPVRLDWANATTVRISGVPVGSTVAFPDDTAFTINGPLDFTVTGAAGSYYYCYLKVDNLVTPVLYISTTAPDARYGKMHTLGTRSVLVGYLAFSSQNSMSGNWCVCSFAHEPTRVWETPIVGSETVLNLPGLIVAEGRVATLSRTGQSCVGGSCCVTLGARSCSI